MSRPITPRRAPGAAAPNMTTARYQGVAVAPGNGLIYVIGGWNNGTPTSVVEAYDPVGNTWTSEASLGHLSGCSVGGRDQRPDLRLDGLRRQLRLLQRV